MVPWKASSSDSSVGASSSVLDGRSPPGGPGLRGGSAPRPRLRLGPGRGAGEEHPEEVGEAGITGAARRPELVPGAASLAAGRSRAAPCPEAAEAGERPTGRERVRTAATAGAGTLVLIPVGAEQVVLLALVRVREDGVCLVDVLEPLLGGLVAGVPIGVMGTRELPERLLDVGLAGRPGHPEDLVVVAVLHRQSPQPSRDRPVIRTGSPRAWDALVALHHHRRLIGRREGGSPDPRLRRSAWPARRRPRRPSAARP